MMMDIYRAVNFDSGAHDLIQPLTKRLPTSFFVPSLTSRGGFTTVKKVVECSHALC